MKKHVDSRLSYDELKRLFKIPATWGAMNTGGRFRERASEPLRAGKKS
jgi:hypothetical protein